MDKVDVVVLTKNSAATLKYVLEGIFNAVPVNKLIIVDGNSTDGTLSIAEESNAKIIKGARNLATARYQGVLEVETGWFCFIDSDIYVLPSWYKQLEKRMALPHAAWIQGLTLEHSRILDSYALSKTLRYTKHGCIALSNSLLKRDVVLQCADWLRKDIHAGEDAVLYKFVKSSGYKVLLDTSALCIHLPDCFFHDIYALYRAGYSDRLRRKHIAIMYLGVPLLLSKEAFIRMLLVTDPRLLIYFPAILGTSYILGYFGFKKSKVFMEKIDKVSKAMRMNPFLLNEVKRKVESKVLGRLIDV
jgi:glycosyltransferase involved in cell wall biosynthesis